MVTWKVSRLSCTWCSLPAHGLTYSTAPVGVPHLAMRASKSFCALPLSARPCQHSCSSTVALGKVGLCFASNSGVSVAGSFSFGSSYAAADALGAALGAALAPAEEGGADDDVSEADGVVSGAAGCEDELPHATTSGPAATRENSAGRRRFGDLGTVRASVPQKYGSWAKAIVFRSM